jgi:hypothetical protein
VTHRRSCGSDGGELNSPPAVAGATEVDNIIGDDATSVHPDIAGEACRRVGNADATNKPKQKQWDRFADGGII